MKETALIPTTFPDNAAILISHDHYTSDRSLAAGIRNDTGVAGNVTLYKVSTYFNGTNIQGPSTVSPDPNFSF